MKKRSCRRNTKSRSRHSKLRQNSQSSGQNMATLLFVILHQEVARGACDGDAERLVGVEPIDSKVRPGRLEPPTFWLVVRRDTVHGDRPCFRSATMRQASRFVSLRIQLEDSCFALGLI